MTCLTIPLERESPKKARLEIVQREPALIGVVSLLDMYEFKAREYVDLAYQLGLAIAKFGNPQLEGGEGEGFGTLMRTLIQESSDLSLPVTRAHMQEMVREIYRNPNAAQALAQGRPITAEDYDVARVVHHLESIQLSLKSELGSMLFRVVSRERNEYLEFRWLVASPISAKFPTSLRELNNAGSCYALGQSTASVFHSMRALEPGLSALAAPFSVSASYENWQNIIEQIESKIRALGQQTKTPQRIADDKFFGEAVAHLYFVKNAWRNHVAHSRDSYSDDEALKILQHSKEFIESLCPRLKE